MIDDFVQDEPDPDVPDEPQVQPQSSVLHVLKIVLLILASLVGMAVGGVLLLYLALYIACSGMGNIGP